MAKKKKTRGTVKKQGEKEKTACSVTEKTCKLYFVIGFLLGLLTLSAVFILLLLYGVLTGAL